MLYTFIAPLLVGSHQIWSTQGVQQGDPLGPFLSAVGLQAAVEALPSGGALHRWYRDDGVFMGSLPEAEEVLRSLLTSLPSIALQLNMCKTTI